ncbi:MAG TPA: nuclear transport factor 2 family protein [Rhizomicrobium sp.]|nr:nuclear transport factor 2 family protein [Rhizomicrobium sp.]
MNALIGALVGRDIDAALALLTDDVAFYYSNGTALTGKAAFAAMMMANWKRIERYSYQTHDPVWVAQSDSVAAVIYGFSWSGVADGKEVGGSGRGTRIFRRDRGRWGLRVRWRLAHEHLSPGAWQAKAV